MQHKIPKQVKPTLWAVKKSSGEKGGGRDTTKVPPGEGPAGNVLSPWLVLTQLCLLCDNSLCRVPMNRAFFCMCALVFNLKRTLQNKCNRYRTPCIICWQKGGASSPFRYTVLRLDYYIAYGVSAPPRTFISMFSQVVICSLAFQNRT